MRERGGVSCAYGEEKESGTYGGKKERKRGKKGEGEGEGYSFQLLMLLTLPHMS